MRMNKFIILMVGALLCAPAFTACQDDPEPTGGNVAGKDDPAGNGGSESVGGSNFKYNNQCSILSRK